MKNILPLLIILLGSCLATAGETNPWEVDLPFEKATIEYSLSGLENGKEVLYVRNHGKETATHRTTTMNMMGMTKTTKTMEFMDSEWIYTFDLQEQSGTKGVNPQKYMIEEYNKLTKEEKEQVLLNSENLGASIMSGGMGGKVEKKAAKILGFECDRMTMMGTTVYAIHRVGLPLKTEMNTMGMTMVMEATKIDEGLAPEEFFRHPPNIVPEMDPQADAMARAMARETMDMMKDPEAARKGSGNPMMNNQRMQELSPEERQQMQEAMDALKNIFGN